MMKKEIYILTESSGQYEDNVTRSVKAYLSKERAEEITKRLNTRNTQIRNDYFERKYDTDDLINEVFKEWLYEYDRKFHDTYEAYINYNGEGNWLNYEVEDEYEERRDDFIKHSMSDETLRKYGMDDEQIREIRNALMYESYGYDGPPFYHVEGPITIRL